jgi:hypothetical protein
MKPSKTQELLAKAQTCQLEIDLCDKRIAFLTTMAHVLMNDEGFQYVDMILVTRPKNGARPITMPLFPIATREEMVEFYAHETPPITNTKQIGFQRFFNPTELKNDEMLTVEIPLEISLAQSLITSAISKLNNRKDILLVDIEDIFNEK